MDEDELEETEAPVDDDELEEADAPVDDDDVVVTTAATVWNNTIRLLPESAMYILLVT